VRPERSARYFFTTTILGAEIDRGSDIEGVARKDHKIELRRCGEQQSNCGNE